MNILVAGGAGMIGSHLCEALLHAGHVVVCHDNLSTGRLANVDALMKHPMFEFVEHDITRPLRTVVRFDRIYHLASPASPVGYTRLPLETMAANSEGSRVLIERALANQARFLFCSTSEIYGDPLEHPQHEEYRGNVSPIGPRAMYDEAKRFGEAMTMTNVRAFELDGRIVRIFNTYGPHSDLHDGRVVVNFITQALCGEPMTVYGDGMQTRSLCYVRDLVEGLMAVMESDRARGEVFNLGNPDERTVLEIAELIRLMTGSGSPLVFRPPAVGDDPRVRRPNIEKARAVLGWAPRTSLEEGLGLMIQATRAELDNGAKPSHGAHGNGAINGHANGSVIPLPEARLRKPDEKAPRP